MNSQFSSALNGVQGLPAGAQILSPGTQFQAPAGQFSLAQPAMQQALQQDPQDPTKWHIVQVATAPTIAAAPAALQTIQDPLVLSNQPAAATHTAQLVTTVSAAAIANNTDRNISKNKCNYIFCFKIQTFFNVAHFVETSFSDHFIWYI